jgi:hypothetical protein
MLCIFAELVFIIREIGVHGAVPKIKVQTIMSFGKAVVHVMVGGGIKEPANPRLMNTCRHQFVTHAAIHTNRWWSRKLQNIVWLIYFEIVKCEMPDTFHTFLVL